MLPFAFGSRISALDEAIVEGQHVGLGRLDPEQVLQIAESLGFLSGHLVRFA